MFSKILIIEDIDSISLGIITVLKKNFDSEIHSVKYCDEGYLKIKKAISESKPYDLIITDLSFKDDHKKKIHLATGEELIAKLRKESIHPKIIVYAMDEKPFIIKSLLSDHFINAYVIKGRESTSELIDAINSTIKGFTYISPAFEKTFKQQSLFEMDSYDILILRFLSEGHTQDDISKLFKEKRYPSASMSSIEKRINKLKLVLKANNSIQLVAIAKDMKII
ncbi:response regulator [Flavobacterium suzhouense]|uniref:Response regulator n=1 Tax=Flavobacterium suzhouense TaxID=1529638 RepID=A0ABW5NX55_9FLAO